ncbi:hypothetical protein [Alkanindiges illinoisensis]|uniref:hypothetical protein n=1 Tax=Alkanindiges illinoisensis TaxID=197183 RepID=UPI000479D047|nr:hypothetical protein [Alkanindiges illinoisensis]
MIFQSPKPSLKTIESEFIERVCETCGWLFVSIITGFGAEKIRDFSIGRRKPRPIDMRKFIDALGKFNQLTKVRSK